ncbi:MAG: nucleotidyltransferase family protein [Balneolaceae bacterium]
MSAKEEILKILSNHKDSLYKKYPIRTLAIFGSIARDQSNDQSDVDLMVEFDSNIGIRFIDLADELEALLERHVDVVSKNAIQPKYFHHIKNDLIYV